MQPRTTSPSLPDRALIGWEKIFLLALGVTFAFQMISVQIRSTALHRPHTDLGVYTTAAWAVRTGSEIYDITDVNKWHYTYPPLFAIVLAPFATAPAGAEAVLAVPFPVTVFLWYTFSVVCAFWSAHLVASAIEARAGNGRPPAMYGWRWWTLRAVPLFVCLPPILGTLAHGQVNLLMLLFLSGMIASLLKGRSALAGLCLSGAICLKVFPAFLLGYAVWRRDWRCLAGCAAGLFIGVVLVPSVALGPQGAIDSHRRFAEAVLLPGLGLGGDTSRAHELTAIVTTDSQSISAVLHHTVHGLDAHSTVLDPRLRWLGMVLGFILTGVTVLVAGARRENDEREVLFIGALVVNMLLLCPVSHLPFFCLLLPLVAALVHRYWMPARLGLLGESTTNVFWLFTTIFVINFVLRIVPHVPALHFVRYFGPSAYAALLLWALTMGIFIKERSAKRETPIPKALAA